MVNILNPGAMNALNTPSPTASIPDSTVATNTSTATPVQASSSSGKYVAPNLYGPNGQVATANASTTKEQVDMAMKQGWSTTAPSTSDASKISSSSTIQNNASANSATGNATDSNLPPSATSQEISIMNFTGLSLTDLRGMSASDRAGLYMAYSASEDAKNAAEDSKRQEAQKYSSELASENAQFAQARNTLNKDRQNSKDTATAQLAQLNSSGGISSDAGQFMSHIDSQFDLADENLTLQATQAKQALDAGDMGTYSSINANMANTLQTVKANIGNLLNSISANKTTQGNFQQQEQDKAITAADTALQNLPQPQHLAGLPADFGKLNPDQLKSVQDTEAYQLLKKGGITDAAAYQSIRSAATSAYKQQAANTAQQNANTSVQRAQIAAFTAQVNAADKQALAYSAAAISASGGEDFLTAFRLAQSAGKYTKQENSDTIDNLQEFITSGDTESAKRTLTNYIFKGEPASTKTITGGLQTVAEYATNLKAKVMALPKNQQSGFLTGNFQDIAAKFGQNPNPKLQTLGAEFGHLALIYKAEVFGKRAVVSNNSDLAGLYPKITSDASLNFSVLDGLVNTANDVLNGKVKSVIGPDVFDKVYGKGGVIGGGPKASSSTGSVTMTGPKGTFTVDPSMVEQMKQHGYK